MFIASLLHVRRRPPPIYLGRAPKDHRGINGRPALAVVVRKACVLPPRGSALGLQWPRDAAAIAFVVTESGERVGEESVRNPYEPRGLVGDAACCTEALIHSIGAIDAVTAIAAHSL